MRNVYEKTTSVVVWIDEAAGDTPVSAELFQELRLKGITRPLLWNPCSTHRSITSGKLYSLLALWDVGIESGFAKRLSAHQTSLFGVANILFLGLTGHELQKPSLRSSGLSMQYLDLLSPYPYYSDTSTIVANPSLSTIDINRCAFDGRGVP